VIDGNMVSGRTWHDQHQYMREFMKMLRVQHEKEIDRSQAEFSRV
jgi:hypothetical protein